jgi:ribosomal protein L29
METSNIGKRVKVLANPIGIPVGIISKIVDIGSGGGVFIEFYPSALISSEFEILSYTKEDINKDIDSLKKEIAELKLKEKFIIDNNVDEFDEVQYKVFQTLETLDNKDISDIEKSKLISDLISK